MIALSLQPTNLNCKKIFFIVIVNTILVLTDLLYTEATKDRLDVTLEQAAIFDVRPINSTSVNITYRINNSSFFSLNKLDEKNDLENRFDYDLKIRITYQLDLVKLMYVTEHTAEHSCKPIPFKSENTENDINSCKAQVDKFDTLNSTLLKADISLESYCTNHTVESEGTSGTIVIGDLLAHQRYIFSYEIFPIKREEVIYQSPPTFVCMNDSRPLYPPQTDLGSFKVELSDTNAHGISESRRIELYWRPVPRLFTGSATINYELICLDMTEKSVILNHTILDKNEGKRSLNYLFFNNHTYSCVLRSRNYLGNSKDVSHIYLPNSSYIIATQDKFVLNVVATSSDEYVLKWTDLEKLLPSQSHLQLNDKTGPRREGTYTIYWCTIESTLTGCSSIDGMIKVKKRNFLTLSLRGHISAKNRIFGISYRSPSNKYFTGIIWSDCVAHSQTNLAFRSQVLIKATTIAIDHRAILINWHFKGCSSFPTLVRSFEIKYCVLSHLDPCGISSTPINETESIQNYKFNDNRNCASIRVESDLINEKKLEDLDVSTRYAVGMKPVFDEEGDNLANLWSEPVIVQTMADSDSFDDCPYLNSSFWLVAYVTMTFLIISILYLALGRRVLKHYYIMLARYRQTDTGIPERFDLSANKGENLSDMGLKYWINRFPSLNSNNNSTSSESSLNVYDFDTKTGVVTRAKIRRNEQADDYAQQLSSMPDYIPSQLLTSQGDQSTQDSLTGSLQGNEKDDPLSEIDDISVTSHSSFLENILNEERPTNSIFNQQLTSVEE